MRKPFFAGSLGRPQGEAIMTVLQGDSSRLLERSPLYRYFLAEREEIMRHKWLESEKAGRDIGYDQAWVSWVVHHRARWRQSFKLISEFRCSGR